MAPALHNVAHTELPIGTTATLLLPLYRQLVFFNHGSKSGRESFKENLNEPLSSTPRDRPNEVL